MSDLRLISDITVRLISSSGGDHSIVAAARVSTSGEDALQYADPARAEESAGLIRYLMKHRNTLRALIANVLRSCADSGLA
jgi:thymidylate synthase (FAD)